MIGDKVGAAALGHSLTGRALCHFRGSIGGGGYGDGGPAGVNRSVVVAETAVDFPAVQCLRNALQLHDIGKSVNNLKGWKLGCGIAVVQITAAVRTDKMPYGPDCILVFCDEIAAPSYKDFFIRWALGYDGKI